MKKIIYINILSECLIFFLIALISSSIIIWVFQAVNYLDLIVEDGRDFSTYIKFALLNFPKILTKLLPFVIFFSCFYIISKYEANNELIIFWNIGINKIHLVNYFLNFSIIILIFQFLFSIFLVPSFQDLSRKLIRGSEITLIDGLFKEKKFNDTLKGLTIYVEEKEKDNVFKNVYIKKNTNENSFQITYAKKGLLVQKENFQILELYDGETINETNNSLSSFFFSKSDFNFASKETNILTVNKIQEMSTLDIFICLNDIFEFNFKVSKKIDKYTDHNCSKNGIQNLYQELYKRFILPFYIPLLVMVSLFLIIKSKEYKYFSKLKILIFLLGFFIIILSETSLKIVSADIISNLKIIFFPVMLIFITYFYLLYIFKIKFRKKKI